MTWYEILIIVLAAAFVIGVFGWRIVRKKQGRGGCDCGCSDCSHCTLGKGRGLVPLLFLHGNIQLCTQTRKICKTSPKARFA